MCPVHGNEIVGRTGCRFCKSPKAPGSLRLEADRLLRALWGFIENVTDEDPDRTNRFFSLRARVREYYDHNGPQFTRRTNKLADRVTGTFGTISGTYRIVRDTKPIGRDYRNGDERTIKYISGQLRGQVIEQVFLGPTKTGGWFDL